MKFENFIKYGQHLQLFKIGARNNKVFTIQGQDKELFIENVIQSYDNTHLYFIQEDAKQLLMLTKPPSNTDISHLPYNDIFIDVNFTKEEIKKYTNIDIEYDSITGIIIQKGSAYDYNTKIFAGNTVRIITLVKNRDYSFFFLTFNVCFELLEEFKDYTVHIEKAKQNKNTEKFCKKFSTNFLNFVLDPEVITTYCEKDTVRNKKRIKNNKIALPSSTNIVLDGKRRIYVNNLVSSGSMSYNYKFWVQGHYRILKSERYKEKKGLKLWIPPFIKGKGILFEKKYVVKKDKNI